jgi:methylglyoxal synthase
MNIALIAHDKKKDALVQFVTAYEKIFTNHNLFATGTTGSRIMEATSPRPTVANHRHAPR